jgi:hypothetical protein
VHLQLFLRLEDQAIGHALRLQGALVDLLLVTGAEAIVHRHRRADDAKG